MKRIESIAEFATRSVLFAALISPTPVLAIDAGNVLFATGSVNAERSPPVALSKGDAVLVSDTIATGEASRAQILMLDGAKLAIRPNSRLRIEEFVYSGPVPEPGKAIVTSEEEKSVARLLKGGFRTITGAIGKDNAANYEVRTAVGVLGIRGTDYTAVFCNGDCDWAPGVSAAAPLSDGLYLGVTTGTIVFRNEVGSIVVPAGEYAFIPLSDRQPRKLSEAPSVLLQEIDMRGATADNSLSGFDAKLGARRAPDSTRPDIDPNDDGTAGDDNGRDAPTQNIIATDPNGQQVDITPGAPDPTRQ